ncbi:MAG: hypothetical protein ACOH2M_18575 [Cypionkella sp.]
MTIMINGTSINRMTVPDIIAGSSADLQPSSSSNPYYRNRDLLRLFHNVETISEHVLTTRFRKLYVDRGHSDEFVAWRAGQMIAWGIEERLIEAVPGDGLAWKLVEREPVFEFIGRERDQNAQRVRNFLPENRVEGEAIWAKEAKRRDRAAAKLAKERAAKAAMVQP